MSNEARNLPVLPADISMQIESMRSGGLIEAAVGMPQQGMDDMVLGHIGVVERHNHNDNYLPERPTYIFSPDTGLLINYAYRHDEARPDRSGFFADVVELDEGGKPRHGVGLVDPFKTTRGFVNVSIGENRHGFTPSSVNFKQDSMADPTSVVPPNIEMADLIGMLQANPIPEGMDLNDFLATRKANQDSMRGRVQARISSGLRSEQCMAPATDANFHLIISDRDDTSALEAASREVGVFPIVLPAHKVVAAAFEWKRRDAPHEVFDQLARYVPVDDSSLETVRNLLWTTVPAFFSFDFESLGGANDKRWAKRKVPNRPEEDARVDDIYSVVDSLLLTSHVGRGMPASNIPFFSKIINKRWRVNEEDPSVRKTAHGVYELGIGTDVENMRVYTDWLRKARLDFALTLYLRGLSKL